MNGIWKLRFGQPASQGLFDLSSSPVHEELLCISPCPLSVAAIETEQVLDRFVLRIPLNPAERLYGLGLNFQHLSLNMKVMHLRADHYGGKDNGRTHAPVPFYVSSGGYGVLIDTAENISFYMGGAVRVDAKNPPAEMNRGRDENWQCNQPAEYVEASFTGQGVHVYLIAGDRPRDVVAQFNLLCGGGCMPPKWGLGFWHRVHYKYGQKEILDELSKFDAHGLPVDVLGLEPGWQSASYPCSFEWDKERFPDPAAFVGQMAQRHTRVNLWENMYVSRKARIYPEILPYCGSHQVWGGAVPDYTLPEARNIVMQQHRQDHPGISGYKVDECDGYDHWLWPDHARFPSGHSATAIRNVFGVTLQRMFYEAYHSQNKRTYGLVRASNAGASSLPFCIYNDCYDFRQFLTGLATAGFCGVLWVPEARNAHSGEEWVRRFQLCALSPMLMLNAWSDGTKPWQFPEVADIITAVIRFRKSLLPYLYQSFHDYQTKGIPPFRAPVMDYADMSGSENKAAGKLDSTDNPYEIRSVAEVVDQYMIGEFLMVAPMLPGQKERTVTLPPDDWHDYYTGEKIEQKFFTYVCPLDRIPLFVKAGGMIPLLAEDGTLKVHCYGSAGTLDLYDDDGETFDYEQSIYAVLHLSFTRNEKGQIQGKAETETHGFENTYQKIEFC